MSSSEATATMDAPPAEQENVQRITIQQHLPDGSSREFDVTWEQLDDMLADMLFTGSITVSKSEKRQTTRQYESNDYFMSMQLDMSGLGAFLGSLNGMPVELKREVKKHGAQLVMNRVNHNFDVIQAILRRRQQADGILPQGS